MLFCSNAILQIMGFAYRIALSRTAMDSALGLNSLVMQVYQMIVSVCISGLNIAVAGFAAKLDSPSMARLFKSSFIIFTFLWLLMAVPLMIAGEGFCKTALGNGRVYPTVCIMLVCIFMTGVENILKSIHIGTKNVRQCAVSELCEQAARFLLVINLLKGLTDKSDENTVFYIMLGMVFSEFVSVGFLLTSFGRKFGLKDKGSKKGLYIREITDVGFPATLTAVASTFFASIGSLILPNALMRYGLTYNGALAQIGEMNTVCVPITMLPMAFVGALSAVLMPEIRGIVERNGSPWRLIRRAFSFVTVAGAVASLLLFVFYRSISQGMFGRSPDHALMGILIIKGMVIYLQVTSIAVLNGLLKQRTVLVFAVLGELYQLILIMLTVPVLGINGYAASMVVGEALRLACNMLSVKKHMPCHERKHQYSVFPRRRMRRTDAN